jgi:uncharacterized protein (DUF4415 family)
VNKKNSQRKSKTDWARVDAMRDEDIVIDDDAPELPADFWEHAKLFVPPAPKHQLSMRLDGDVLEWFKGQGKGYQQHINFALRSYMQQAKRSVAKHRKA